MIFNEYVKRDERNELIIDAKLLDDNNKEYIVDSKPSGMSLEHNTKIGMVWNSAMNSISTVSVIKNKVFGMNKK